MKMYGQEERDGWQTNEPDPLLVLYVAFPRSAILSVVAVAAAVPVALLLVVENRNLLWLRGLVKQFE